MPVFLLLLGNPCSEPLGRQMSASAHILLSRRCSDSVCFLRVFCRVDNVVSRRTLDPQLILAVGHANVDLTRAVRLEQLA